MNRDLNQISNDDYSRVVTIFIITLFVILAVIFRSLILPISMIGSIFVTYFASITITQWFLGLFGLGDLNWAVPFFSLIICGTGYIAPSSSSTGSEKSWRIKVYGMRLNIPSEEWCRRHHRSNHTIRYIPALLPSGMIIPIQVASIIIFALLFYAFIVLPLLVPAFVVTFGRGNWWLFRMPGGKEREAKFKDEE